MLGDRLLHIAELDPSVLKPLSDSDKDRDNDAGSKSTQLMTTCCRSHYTETEIFERSKRTLEELIDADEAELGEVVKYSDATSVERRRRWLQDDIDRGPHFDCLDEVTKPWGFSSTDAMLLPVQILRVCRQIYTEANPIMWSTNMFSFKCANAFRTFLRARSTAQKATISKLRIDLYLSNGVGPQKDSTGFYVESYISTLKNLRTLSVNVDYGAWQKGQSAHYVFGDYVKTLLQREFNNLLRYKIFPLRTVNVVIRNTTCTEEEDKLPLADRAAIAEAMRQVLLDPERAQTYVEWRAFTKAGDAELHAGPGSNAFIRLRTTALR